MAIFSRRNALSASLLMAILATLTVVSVRPVSSAQDNFTLTSTRLQGAQLTMKVDEEVDVTIDFTPSTPGADIIRVKAPDSNEFIDIT